jgi:Lrp/AsnC family transcriptional regulator for asnA, asnC and gidA
MDSLDLNIIKMLKKDAQMPFSRIARQLGVSTKTVLIRYERMREKRIIWNTTISIDISKIGYQGKVYLMITNAANQDPNLTTDALNQMLDVFIVTEILGEFDVLAIAFVKDVECCAKLIRDVKALPSVSQVEFVVVTDKSFPIDKTYDRLPLQLPNL